MKSHNLHSIPSCFNNKGKWWNGYSKPQHYNNQAYFSDTTECSMTVCIPCRNWENPSSSIDHDNHIDQMNVDPFVKPHKQSIFSFYSETIEGLYNRISESLFEIFWIFLENGRSTTLRFLLGTGTGLHSIY